MLCEFRLRQETRFLTGSAVALFAAFPFILYFAPHHRVVHVAWVAVGIIYVLGMGGLGRMLLAQNFCRVVATGDGIESYDWLGRLKVSVPFDELTNYRQTTSSQWRIATAEKEYRLPEIEFDDFHRLMVSHARRALKAKRWQTGQIPPSAEVDEPLLNTQSFVLGTCGFLSLMAILALLFKSVAPIGGISPQLWRHLFQLKDVLGRLRMSDESVSASWLRGSKHIRWEEVQAVFQVQQAGQRCFVVTSEIESIFIPHHIASDLEAMRKFFYSIPQGTLCVNFDEKSTKGYRRRRRKLVGRKLEPAISL